MVGSKGGAGDVKGYAAAPAGDQPVRGPACAWSSTYTGEPQSDAVNSPTCHCRASSHSGSRTGAASDSATEFERGRGSRRFQKVIEGGIVIRRFPRSGSRWKIGRA